MYSYIHIPFCESKCKYCRFASVWDTQKLKIEFYKKFLLQEIKTSSFALSKWEKLNSLYFWWGTPTTFSPYQLSEVINTMREKYSFVENIEISIESTPNKVVKESIALWKESGINRVSMWVQTLNPQALQEIWREDKGSILEALENLRDGGIENISIDFIIGLPYVGKWELLRDITYVLENYDFVKHVSVYMLEEYYDVWEEFWDESDSKYDKVVYPTDWSKKGIAEEEYLEEYNNIKLYLESKGYMRYEISNFTQPWYECRHNKAYWNHSEVIAFWLGASGFINNMRYTNSDDFNEYYNWKNTFQEDLSENDILLERVMFWLRTSWLEKRDLHLLNQERLDYFLGNHYLEYSDDSVILWDKWIVYLDYIVRELI